jgi:hypothetical protein
MKIIFTQASQGDSMNEDTCGLVSSDFDIFFEIQYASCVFGLALKS